MNDSWKYSKIMLMVLVLLSTAPTKSLSVLFVWNRPLNPVTNFDFFISNCCYSTYETNIFAELADKGLYGCIPVVGAD